MNKFIKEQLKKCKVNFEWDDSSTHIVVPFKKSVRPINVELEIGHRYIISIADYVINEPSNFTLSSNWNSGSKPPESQMEITVIKYVGKMINVSGVGITSKTEWSGFLPKKSITIERCLS